MALLILDMNLSGMEFLKPRLKLTFRYVQN